ncbi:MULTISPECIES: GyrI-like domain-containing protein [Enterobacter]|uniref:GyrI-like domain-containing protein n=1 Tax=Enterobacter TaxID=547 RepID=UPI00373ED950
MCDGLSLRTRNIDESSSKTARIPGLWIRFYSERVTEKIKKLLPHAQVFGVYSAYETDASSFYDLTIGVSVDKTNLNDSF